MTTTIEPSRALVGPGVDRVDGRLKVTGAARYPSDFSLPEMAYAALVRSTIAAGTIARLDTAHAAAAPGVLVVITHENAGRLHKAKRKLLYPPRRRRFRTRRSVITASTSRLSSPRRDSKPRRRPGWSRSRMTATSRRSAPGTQPPSQGRTRGSPT